MKLAKSAVMTVALVGLFAGLAHPQASSEERFAALKKAAFEVLVLEDVEARGRVSAIFEYAHALVGAEQRGAALEMWERGLRIHPWALDEQLAYARALAAEGSEEKALERARIVEQHAEDDALVLAARMLRGEREPGQTTRLAEDVPGGPCLVLVPMGTVDELLVREIARTVESRVGFPVVVRAVGLTLPPAARDPLAEYAKQIKETVEFLGGKIERRFREYLKDAADETPDDVIAAYRKALGQDETAPDLQQLDTWVTEARNAAQWDAVVLRSLLREKTRPHARPGVAFLGISKLDIFASDYNFVYGQATEGIGVMSYHRFRGAFNDESPLRSRLLTRSVKQALSSTGHVYGVPRCSDPTCARAFPISMAEHDAKGDKLCATCVQGLAKRIGTSK